MKDQLTDEQYLCAIIRSFAEIGSPPDAQLVSDLPTNDAISYLTRTEFQTMVLRWCSKNDVPTPS